MIDVDIVIKTASYKVHHSTLRLDWRRGELRDTAKKKESIGQTIDVESMPESSEFTSRFDTFIALL